MLIDEKTLNKLEYNRIREELFRLSSFEGGQIKAEEMRPSSDIELISRRLDETGEAMEAMRFSEPAFLYGLKPVESQLAKVKVGGILSPAELREIYHILSSSRQVRKLFAAGKYPRLFYLSSKIEEVKGLENEINNAVSEDAELKDDASPELKSLRGQINTLRLRIRNYLQEFIRSPDTQKWLQDSLVTEREGRYVVPVRQEFRHEVRGIIHDESASGATVFIEPVAVVENNNRIRALQRDEKREVERILRKLSEAVGQYRVEIAGNQELLSELDFIYARARLAYQGNYYRPEINTKGILEISRGRHPLLGQDAVPLDIRLGSDFDVLVITGPNTGGKTVALKTVGLLTLMGLSGLFIPARENSRISVFQKLFVDIGDEQSIEQSLSTFSSHMTNIIAILEKADKESLVLMDEVGAGTDPAEGAALARVILEELLKKRSRVILTTHQSELKYFAYQRERVKNASVEFDPVSLKPTYKLSIGMPGQSNALEIASRLGLKAELVQQARQLLPRREMEIGNMIRHLKESQSQVEKSRQEAEKLEAELLEKEQRLEQDRESFEQEKTEVMEKSRYEAERYLRDIKREANTAIEEFKELMKEKEEPPKWHEVEQARQKIRQIKVELPGEVENCYGGNPVEIKPGDHVNIRHINQRGYVVKGPNSQGEVLVQVGILKLNVKQEQLSPSQEKEEIISHRRYQSFLEKARTISKEIDVRGQLAEDALYIIDKYLEDANLLGLDSVRIIHGKGTGALRTAVRHYLKDHRYVKSYRDGLREEGGHGVTVVEFN
ncbi:MAG: endonuclease MutS2 [Syntrophomonas sp.]|uniref:endonuclease MutS2 n=1 Tax=Syntrophomonas sp. TaxID=2053627 RepID=UPI002616DC53|nr:endonuclease MutS2 [Syntrophomonas sp.]MDD2511082.1 endonuclease MutS2 [Syntrophomonas sp.]MDD4627307.1 endonuclease MutS2 [Syntrophomonas sp.]